MQLLVTVIKKYLLLDRIFSRRAREIKVFIRILNKKLKKVD
jgi:hypothetical protein